MTKILIFLTTIFTTTLAALDRNNVYIEGITYGGSGCPQNSMSQSLNSDRTSFTLIFDKMVASIGPGVKTTENRKNCQINVNMHYPPGQQYAVASMIYRGSVDLSSGQVGQLKTIYYFQGQMKQATAFDKFIGPINNDYSLGDTMNVDSKVWSDCQQTFPININTQVVITGDSSKKGSMSSDSIDGKVSYEIAMLWKQC